MYFNTKFVVVVVVPDVVSCHIRKNVFGPLSWPDGSPLLSCVGPEVVRTASIDSCNLESRMNPCFFDRINSIDYPQSPLVFLMTKFVIETDSMS